MCFKWQHNKATQNRTAKPEAPSLFTMCFSIRKNQDPFFSHSIPAGYEAATNLSPTSTLRSRLRSLLKQLTLKVINLLFQAPSRLRLEDAQMILKWWFVRNPVISPIEVGRLSGFHPSTLWNTHPGQAFQRLETDVGSILNGNVS